MVDPKDQVTTGLLTAIRFAKDNRILPRGFDKTTAHGDIAAKGRAKADADFKGGEDAIRYAIDLAGALGPFDVHAELWYQPIAYRWAQNLSAYDAMETKRFVGYYNEMAQESAAILAQDQKIIE